MTSSLPTLPGHRFAYDIDGSFVSATPVGQSGGVFSAVDATLINDEDSGAWNSHPSRSYGYWRELAIAFPEARDLTGYHVNVTGLQNPNGQWKLFTSTDTTDGSNGTWVDQGVPTRTDNGNVLPYARTAITPVSFLGIRGVRFRFAEWNDWTQVDVRVLHLYGYTNPATNPERLEFWDPTMDQQAARSALDFEDLPQGSVATKQVRVKNLSATKTASGVVFSANNGAGGDAGLASGMTFSLDNSAYTPTLDIGSIAPGAVSPVVYCRRTVGATEAAMIRFARVLATPTTYA